MVVQGMKQSFLDPQKLNSGTKILHSLFGCLVFPET
jgi:hypothetical protein